MKIQLWGCTPGTDFQLVGSRRIGGDRSLQLLERRLWTGENRSLLPGNQRQEERKRPQVVSGEV